MDVFQNIIDEYNGVTIAEIEQQLLETNDIIIHTNNDLSFVLPCVKDLFYKHGTTKKFKAKNASHVCFEVKKAYNIKNDNKSCVNCYLKVIQLYKRGNFYVKK